MNEQKPQDNIIFAKIIVYGALILIAFGFGWAFNTVIYPFGWLCGSVVLFIGGLAIRWIERGASRPDTEMTQQEYDEQFHRLEGLDHSTGEIIHDGRDRYN